MTGFRKRAERRVRAFTLLELLCVIAIILILVGLMLGPIFRAYKRAKRLDGDDSSLDVPQGKEQLASGLS
jgi:prepilin-type N-terminal cleavage/methylation domain-containing protein